MQVESVSQSLVLSRQGSSLGQLTVPLEGLVPAASSDPDAYAFSGSFKDAALLARQTAEQQALARLVSDVIYAPGSSTLSYVGTASISISTPIGSISISGIDVNVSTPITHMGGFSAKNFGVTNLVVSSADACTNALLCIIIVWLSE
jgi:hypothetical protein